MLAVSELEIRKVVPSDVDGVVELENACFDDPYPRYFLEQLAVANPDAFLVAVAEGRVLGYAVVDKWEDHDHLLSIAVSRERRRGGIGQRLFSALDATLRNTRPMRLEVRKSNSAAIQFYSKNGFTESGVAERYYLDGEDALLMERRTKLTSLE